MKSKVMEDFVARFARLPASIKAQARKNYRIWRTNSAHPGLHFKRIHGHEEMYSVRVGLGWRAVGLLEGDTIYWFWVGSHAEYDKLLQQL
ncbi:MAG: hypothetical protein L0228_16140 [Planctomycetes bacterium]|nr:hypothetical protein [Planctomycetota bacterium]